jgi:hypothetical protein
VERVRDARGDAGVLQLDDEPFPVEGGFHRDSDRRRQRGEPLPHCVDRGRQLAALSEDGTVRIEGTRSDVALMEIETDSRHGSLPRGLR